jgi:hypothetical protein
LETSDPLHAKAAVATHAVNAAPANKKLDGNNNALVIIVATPTKLGQGQQQH